MVPCGPGRGPPRQPAQPTWTLPCRLPPRAPKVLGGKPPTPPTPPRRPAALHLPPRPPSSDVENPPSSSSPFPPPGNLFLLFPVRIPRRPERPVARRRGNPWPPSSSAAATLSRTRAVVVFIAVCKQSKPGAPSPSSSSPSRRWTRNLAVFDSPSSSLPRLHRLRRCTPRISVSVSPRLASPLSPCILRRHGSRGSSPPVCSPADAREANELETLSDVFPVV